MRALLAGAGIALALAGFASYCWHTIREALEAFEEGIS